MAGVKISQLQDGGALQNTDAFPVARGSFTRKIAGSELLTPTNFNVADSPTIDLDWNSTTRTLSADVSTAVKEASAFNVVDSPTIDLNWNASTRTLSADVITSSFGFIPTGAIMVFPSTIAPTGWLALSGQLVSRTAFPILWSFAQSSGNIVTDTNWFSISAIGSFSQGDGSTTFRIPDLRGEFVRGWDDGRGVDPARGIGGWQKGSAMPYDSGSAVVTRGVGAASTIPDTARQQMGYDGINVSSYTGAQARDITSTASGGVYDGNSEGGFGVTRPRNIALLYCIKF